MHILSSCVLSHGLGLTRLPASTSVLGGLGLNAFIVRKHFNGTGGTGVLKLYCLEGLMSHFINCPVQFIFLKKVFYRLEDLGDQGERKERHVKLKQLKATRRKRRNSSMISNRPYQNLKNGSRTLYDLFTKMLQRPLQSMPFHKAVCC